MAFTINNDPGKYSISQSPIRYNLTSDNFESGKKFKYISSLLSNPTTIVSSSMISVEDGIIYRFTTNGHSFQVGDRVYLDSSDLDFRGNYFVMSIDGNDFILDMDANKPYTSNNTKAYRTIEYRQSPNPSGSVDYDFHTVLKDYVSSRDFKPLNEIMDASSTRFDYGINFGEEYRYELPFYLIGDSNGRVRYRSNTTTTPPFQVGDRVRTELDLLEISYKDNFFFEGQVGFWTDVALDGQYMRYIDASPNNKVYVTGQITNPQYNGWSNVVRTLTPAEMTDLSNEVGVTVLGAFIVDRDWGGSTPPEGGKIHFHLNPQYIDVSTITQIDTSGNAYMVSTDRPFGHTIPGVPLAQSGRLMYADGRMSTFQKEMSVTNCSVFDGKLNLEDYTSSDNMEDQVLDGIYDDRNISIAYKDHTYRIERNTQSWLLVHTENTSDFHGVKYTFTLNDGSTEVAYCDNEDKGTSKDWYFPVSLKQLHDLNDDSKIITTGTPLLDYYDDIVSYSVEAIGNFVSIVDIKILSKPVNFIVNEDCSTYDNYSLIYKDKLGSYISIPMIYKAQEFLEVDKTDHYQRNMGYNINKYDRGVKSFYSKSREKFSLNSGFLNDNENKLFKDMITSNDVYIQKGSEDMLPCVVVVKDLEIKNMNNNSLFQYRIEIQKSIDEIRY